MGSFGVMPFLFIFLYFAIIGFGLWVVLRIVQALEKQATSLEDIATLLKKHFDGQE